MSARFTHVVGIDEVGRGPIAGPVAVCATAIKLQVSNDEQSARNEYNKLFSQLPACIKIKDSKKLSPQKRREVLPYVKDWEIAGKLNYSVSFISSEVIDSVGISKSIFTALSDCLEELNLNPATTLVLLDGALHAPKKYIFQETIIKGDDKEMIIALASIIAKVARDDVMEQYGMVYPEYKFEEHKGYGTSDHYKYVKKYGLSPLHRRSFLKAYC